MKDLTEKPALDQQITEIIANPPWENEHLIAQHLTGKTLDEKDERGYEEALRPLVERAANLVKTIVNLELCVTWHKLHLISVAVELADYSSNRTAHPISFAKACELCDVIPHDGRPGVCFYVLHLLTLLAHVLAYCESIEANLCSMQEVPEDCLLAYSDSNVGDAFRCIK